MSGESPEFWYRRDDDEDDYVLWFGIGFMTSKARRRDGDWFTRD